MTSALPFRPRTPQIYECRKVPGTAAREMCRGGMRTIPAVPDDRRISPFIAMCGRLSVGKSELSGSAGLVGAAMCSTC